MFKDSLPYPASITSHCTCGRALPDQRLRIQLHRRFAQVLYGIRFIENLRFENFFHHVFEGNDADEGTELHQRGRPGVFWRKGSG